MKRLKQTVVLLLVMFCGVVANAGVRTFVWDAYSDSLIRFTVYRHSAPDVQAITSNIWLQVYPPGENPDVNDLLNVEYVINSDGDHELTYDIKPDGTWYFVLTATNENWEESGRSNEVSATIDDSQPAVPTAPWEFEWMPHDPVQYPDIIGYRIYLVPWGQPIIIGDGSHFWQGDSPEVFPLVLDIPEGHWEAGLTAYDANGNEGVPDQTCEILIDLRPPTPTGYSCQVIYVEQ